MSDKTGIQWTDATWNPVSGCSKVSTGCTNCYAERDWARLSKNPKSPYFGRAFTDVRCHPERLDQPLRWRRPRRIFVNSMSDLFHEDVPFDFVRQVCIVMTKAAQHTFQILTKRPERMRSFFSLGAQLFPDSAFQLAPNIWLGASIEDQATADKRIPVLLETPAAVRFLSIEPMLESIDIDRYLWSAGGLDEDGIRDVVPSEAIDWIIVGGESGPSARPFNVDWARSLRDQCREAQVAFYLKQLGANPDFGFNELHVRHASPIFDRHGGDPAEWPEDLRVREFPR
jgi:protein gp37